MTFFDQIKNSLKGRVQKSSKKEVRDFVNGLGEMTDNDMGVIVAVVTVLRVNMEKEGYLQKDLFGDTPLPSARTLGQYQMDLNKLARDFNRKGQPTDAIATMVISYTLRSLNVLELRDEGRELWRQLKRGFGHVEQALIDGEKNKGEAFLKSVWTEWKQIPVGLEPIRDTRQNPRPNPRPNPRQNPWKKT